MANYLPYYWIRHGAVPKEMCDIVLAERKQMADAAAGVGLNNEKAPDGLRKTGIAWAERNHWLEGVMLNNIHYANKETRWNIDITTHYNEQVQLAKYEEGHFYDWHKDTFFLTDAETCRKITAVVLLNDPCEFTGGDFELEGCSAPIVLQKGAIIVFPSYLQHRATPVTWGTRYSAALWVHGPNFR